MTKENANSGSTASAAPAAETRVLLPAIERLGIPVFLFGVIFLLATVALTQILTPDRFPVRIGDKVVRIADLESEQKRLMNQKADLTSRPSTVTESRAPVLHQLAVLRGQVRPVGQTLMNIETVRASFKAGDADPIAIPQMDAEGSGGRLRLGGEVKDVGGRSMQILASFVDGLRAIPTVETVTEPEYSQHKDPAGITVSPFSVTVTLKHVFP